MTEKVALLDLILCLLSCDLNQALSHLRRRAVVLVNVHRFQWSTTQVSESLTIRYITLLPYTIRTVRNSALMLSCSSAHAAYEWGSIQI